MADQEKTKCVVIGAGPVGALSALYAAKAGWEVEVYELRGDLRHDSTTPLNFTKSINLALSERGINAMRRSGSDDLLETVLAETIPMHGRMIHVPDANGGLTEQSQQYDVHGRPILAVDRGSLNSRLLDELERQPNVKLFFHHKLTGVDFEQRKAWLELKSTAQTQGRAKEIELDFDLIIGCDGAHSSVRYHMMKYVRMDYSQSYIDCLWCEFSIPAASDSTTKILSPSAKDGFATSPNHLHIWPSKDDQMFIAIPSADKSFTCTLFAPAATFAALERDPSTLPAYFDTHFPGAGPLVGYPQLQSQFASNPHLPLISIKCSPHHHTSTGVFLGDAAHAMVPFYGQGMNAGLEDVTTLFSHLSAHHSTPSGRAEALAAYSAARVPDAHTINDLALDNYWEMHAGVQSRAYLLRKRVEEFLADWVPASGVRTQYTRVSFSNQRYSEVLNDVQSQGLWLRRGLGLGTLLPLTGLLAWGAVRLSGTTGRIVRGWIEAIRGR